MKTILLVDDEPTVINVLRRILKVYKLIETQTGEDALLYFADGCPRVDLLIADLTLPRISGIQVALSLRANLPALPVILTSGYPVDGWGRRDSADLERLGSHLVTILQKPFTAQVLTNGVRRLIGEEQAEDKVRTA
jgi:CheY-like chemotaxis protein